MAKLVSGKVTFVHRRLWPALLAAATSREAWQTLGLSEAGRGIADEVQLAGSLRTDQIATVGKGKARNAAVGELERRLIVRSTQEHTETGAHAKVLEPWEPWAATNKIPLLTVAEAKLLLEQAAADLVGSTGSVTTLPWQAPSSRARSSR